MPRDVYGPSSSARLGEGPLLRFAYKPHTKTVTFLVVVLQATASMMCWKNVGISTLFIFSAFSRNWHETL